MSDIRLFVDAALVKGAAIRLDGTRSNYIVSVMRQREGDRITIFDGQSGDWTAVIDRAHPRHADIRVEHRIRPPETMPDLLLMVAPIKRGRIDWLAEKACELGVHRLQLVATERSVVDRVNLDRLRAHMVEAAEQCGRNMLPALTGLAPLRDAMEGLGERRLIFCDEAGGVPMADALQQCSPGPAAILIGPEGGFTDAERSLLANVPGVVKVSLGPRVLRADTAAVAAVALWQAAHGDWSS